MNSLFLAAALLAVCSLSAQADTVTTIDPTIDTDMACVAAVAAAASAAGATITRPCATTRQVTSTYVPPTAPPKPTDEIRTVQCVAPTTGAWTQSHTWTLVNNAWVAAAWLPSSAPTGACTTSPPTTNAVQIKSGAGFCLDAATPAAIVQQACDATKASQAFSTAIAGRYAVAGQCLALSSNVNGTQLSMAPCTDPSTAWTTPAGNVKNTANGRCIDIPLSQVNVAGAIAQGWSCDTPTSTEQTFTKPAIGGTPPPPPPPTGGMTASMWADWAIQRIAFGDPNDCKARVDAIPTIGFMLAPGGNIASALASNSVVLLQTGVYPVTARFGVPPGKVLAAAPGQKPIIDLKTATDWWVIGVGNNATFAGIEVRNSPGWGITAFNLPGGTYANGGLIYQVVVHDNGMDSRAADNGTGIIIGNGAKNWCVVDAEVFNTYNAGGSGATANGGNSDGVANNFGASQNTFIYVRAHNNGDDGFDMWQGGQSYWYFSSASDNGKVPGKSQTGDGNGIKLGTGSVSHKFYKTTANNNASGGFNLNGNTQQPTLVQTSATGNPAGNYMNGVNLPPPPPPASGAQTATFTQSNEDFLNPGRGMYITPNDTEMGNVSTLTGFVTRWNTRLFQYAPNMSAFMNSNLSAAWLSSLSSKLANARSAGVKIILLPRYQDGGTCTDSPLWKTHLQQLGVVLKANADVLADPIRAGFAGAWGEGWCSSNGLEQGGTNEAAFIAAWDAARPPTHHIAFHTYIASKYPTNPMMGTKNDCILATNTDAHNFDSLSDPRRATIGAMSKQGHPYGGETCDSTSEGNGQQRKSCAQARTELAAMGVSFLNKAYSPVFLDSWTAGGCFDEISRSVGYRFFLPSINYDGTGAAGQPMTVAVKVQNVGWSANFDDRSLIVSLRNRATGAIVSGPAGKLRQVAGGATATMSAVLTAPAGTYDILLSAPDPFPSIAADVRYAVRFANADNGAQKWVAPYFQTGASIAVN